MAHYAILDENNIVVSVIVGNDEGEVDWEEYYESISGSPCKRTSYNTYGNTHLSGGKPFRLNYAGIGYEYREDLDGFIAPQPYNSWNLNEETGLWNAPVEKPEDNDESFYVWDEDSLSWQSVKIVAPQPEPVELDYIIELPSEES